MALPLNIYNVDGWESSRSYILNEPTLISGYYRYCALDHTSTASFDSSKWMGLDLNGPTPIPEFIWIPTYPMGFPSEPKNKIIQFGDGYSQRSPGQINNNLLSIDLRFEGRDLAETTAICHFLYNAKGCNSFYFTPPPPYQIKKLFICKAWNPEMIFYQTYNITTRFEEVPV